MQLVLEALQSFAAISNASLAPSGALNELPYPGLPTTNPPASSSYWMAHNGGPGATLRGHGKLEELPRHVDVVM